MGGTDREESAANSAEWSGEETEELASEEEAETVGGLGGVGMMPTATEEGLERSGTENGPGCAAAGGGVTLDVTSKDADTAGAGGGGPGD